MQKLRAMLAGLSIVTLGACASEEKAEAPRPMNVDPIHIGAGDHLGMQLGRTDRAVAGAEARDRALASHPED